jgi:inorganic phosphate transporter, PiT family
MTSLAIMLILIALAVVFSFFNGFQASAKIVATMVSSRAMTPRAALTIAAVAEFIGPFLLGVAVAKTIGEGIASPSTISSAMVLAALLSASLWHILTWYFGVPSSSSHALIGGLLGAVAAGAGFESIHMDGVEKIAIALFTSPIIGFGAGFLVMRLTLWLMQGATPKANILFKRLQGLTAVALATSYGANDAQKTMGVITLGLIVLGFQDSFVIHWWVILVSALSLAIGTAIGGWRIMRTLGAKFYRIRPIHGFTSQLTAGTIVIVASLLGGPVSTTHVVSTSILSVGAAQRKSQVRWGVMSDILLAWILTVPVTAGAAAFLYLGFDFVIN